MMDDLRISIKRLRADVQLPKAAHVGDAGLDLHAACAATLKPHERALVPCGFAMALPAGYAGLVLPRSGLASKHGLTVANSPGLIDSGYRGEVMVALQNNDAHEVFQVDFDMRIAQLVVIEVAGVTFVECDELDETDRSTGGFGSSGV